MRSTPYELFKFYGRTHKLELCVWVSGHPMTPPMEISRHLLYIYDCNHGINVYMVDRFIVYVFYIRFSMSGSICSDGTSRLVYLQSDHIVTHIPLSIHFRTYISFIISGYSYYVNMLVTRLKSDMCLVFLLHN